MPEFTVRIKTDVEGERISTCVDAPTPAKAIAKVMRRKFFDHITVTSVKVERGCII